MKSKSLLLVAVAAGVLAVVLLNLYLARKEEALGTTVLLLKARKDLPAQTAVRREDFEDVEFPERHIEAFRDPTTKEGSLVIRREVLDHLVERPLRRDIRAGEFLLRSHFEPPLGPSFDAIIPPDMVAVIVPIDRATVSAELIAPGARVDVYAVGETGPRGSGSPTAERLLEGVTVLAVGSQVLAPGSFYAPRERSEASSVTLAVSPAQVPRLAPVWAGRAQLRLALLRPPESVPPAPPAPPPGK